MTRVKNDDFLWTVKLSWLVTLQIQIFHSDQKSINTWQVGVNNYDQTTNYKPSCSGPFWITSTFTYFKGALCENWPLHTSRGQHSQPTADTSSLKGSISDRVNNRLIGPINWAAQTHWRMGILIFLFFFKMLIKKSFSLSLSTPTLPGRDQSSL